MWISQQDLFDRNNHWIWFACASCWTKTNESLICDNCWLEHNDFWEAIETWENLDFMDKVRDESQWLTVWKYRLWFIWDFTTPATQWNRGNTASVEITNIKWLQWRFQELEIKFWSSYIKVDTNWETIKNYRSKKATQNRRGKWFKWERKKPSSLVKTFIEDKLSAKFA